MKRQLIWVSLIVLLFGVSTADTNQSESLREKEIRGSFELDGESWKIVYSHEHQASYYYNTISRNSQWIDPREAPDVQQSQPVRAAAVAQETILPENIVIVVSVVFVLLGALTARLLYLHVYYPEVLFPSKVRKQRRRENNKMKTQRARFKVSQDGKGGSSRNS